MKQINNKFLMFMRKNAVYLILALCIVAIGLSATLIIVNQQDEFNSSLNQDQIIEKPDSPSDNIGDNTDVGTKPDDNVTDPVDVPVTFIMPIENPTSIGEYSDTMVFNSTLGRFSAHMAIDFFASEGTPVYCAYDGKVLSVESTLLKGTTIVIDHGEGLQTVYNSLADGDEVFEGQTVNKGDIIGYVSTSNRQEASTGAHLHFEVKEDGVCIDPSKYLVFNEK